MLEPTEHIIVFQKYREKIIVSTSHVQAILKVQFEDLKSDVGVSIASLNIRFVYPKNDSDAYKKIGNHSLSSFFRYWIQHNGWPKFIAFMADNGFKLTTQKAKHKPSRLPIKLFHFVTLSHYQAHHLFLVT